jgi:hypothetical protein
MHLTALAGRARGAGETARFAERGWGATGAADLEDYGARGLGIDTPAGVDDHWADPGGSPQAIRDELIVQA